MPKIEGHYSVCHCCKDDNETPKFKWCPRCRQKERVRYEQRGQNNPTLKNPCGMGYVEIVRAGDPKDALPDGLRVRPGHAEGWYELM